MSPRRATSSIRSKILTRSLAVALLPLAILAGVVFFGLNQLSDSATTRVDESRAVLEEESTLVVSQDQAESVAREINLVLAERINDVVIWSRNPEVVDAATTGAFFAQREGLVGQPIETLEQQFESTKRLTTSTGATNYLLSELGFSRDFAEIFFTDPNGFNVAWTSETSDFVQSDEEWWQEAWSNRISVSDVEFDESAEVFSVDIAVRIDDKFTASRLGVMKTSLKIDFVQDIATSRSLNTVNYTVALADGRLIAETASAHQLDRMMNPELAPSSVSDGLVTALAATQSGADVTDENVFGYVRTLDPERFGTDFAGFEGFDWVVLSTQSSESAFAPLAGLQDLRSDIEDSGTQLTTLMFLVAGLGVVLAIVMAQVLARGIVGPITRLTRTASDAATTALPAAVNKINEDDGVDLDSVSIPEVKINTGDELETLAESFNSVQGTAVRLAAQQAASRRNTAEMFVNLGRRNQSLLKRQLRFIDGLEKSETDPDTLDSLFKLDHLATRMRRNAESLLVLAGDRTPRRWAAPVDVRDAVQAALAEVEGYERVEMRVADGEVQGNVVADVAHILAELIENALNFSPPQAPVIVNGRKNDEGFTLTVADEGLGMTAEELAAANDRLSEAHDVSKVPSQYLGLFVVGRLAARHDIAVSLGESPAGGLVATVELPSSLTDLQPEVEETEEPASLADSLPTLDGHVPHEDPEIAKAEAEVFALLAQAEEALKKVEEAKKAKTSDDTVVPEPVAADESDMTSAAVDTIVTADQDGADQDGADQDGAAEVSEPVMIEAPPSESEASGFEATESADADDMVSALLETPDTNVSLTPKRRAEDDGTTESDEPEKTVEVGGLEFPRRESPGDESLGRRADDPPMPVAEESLSAPTVEAEPVADPNAPDLAAFGFQRRESKAVDKAESPNGSNGSAPEDRPEEDAMVTAERSRNRWSQFQRAKDEAETTTLDES